MRRALQWSFSAAAVLFAGLAVMMGFVEVVHLAWGEGRSTGHAAGVFAVQALVLAGVFTASALAAERSVSRDRAGRVRRSRL